MAPCDAQARIRELESRVEELTFALEQIAYPVGGGKTPHDALVDAFDKIVGIARNALATPALRATSTEKPSPSRDTFYDLLAKADAVQFQVSK